MSHNFEEVLNDRAKSYGDFVPSFFNIAARWSATLGTRILPSQVAHCLVDMKSARMVIDKDTDTMTDIQGYASFIEPLRRAEEKVKDKQYVGSVNLNGEMFALFADGTIINSRIMNKGYLNLLEEVK